ncbi:hypothetical protein G9A89_006984 [Geosiphon pyriformis]|nr:hypothetical protein G9A89_006984 [Geosiphon pyriformis]
MAYCSAIWSNVRNHGTLLSNVKQYQKKHGTLLSNMEQSLVKDPGIRVEHSIEDSLPEGILAIKLRKKLMKLWFWEATNKTIAIESLSIIQRTQPKLSDNNTFRYSQQHYIN